MGHNVPVMRVESRDSISLKPAELDEFGQLVASLDYPLHDEHLDQHVEQFPLVTRATDDEELHGFLFGSLERIGGTPCILWALGAVRRGREARAHLDALVGELYRRAAISFPDEDVLIAGRFAHPSGYALLSVLADVCPRSSYSPTGEERAWGRRLARRFGCETRYDDRKFRLKAHGEPEPVLHTGMVKAGGKSAASVVGAVEPNRGEALIAFGWATAEALLDGGLAPNGRAK